MSKKNIKKEFESNLKFMTILTVFLVSAVNIMIIYGKELGFEDATLKIVTQYLSYPVFFILTYFLFIINKEKIQIGKYLNNSLKWSFLPLGLNIFCMSLVARNNFNFITISDYSILTLTNITAYSFLFLAFCIMVGTGYKFILSIEFYSKKRV